MAENKPIFLEPLNTSLPKLTLWLLRLFYPIKYSRINLISKNSILITYRKHGHTYFIDFGIGNKEYLGKGLAAITLDGFVKFYKKEVDPLADTFFIDPDLSNPKAKHVYEKAGFVLKGNFEMISGFFKGNPSHLLVKQI